MSLSWKLKWHKLLHWEYWSLQAIYYPLFPVWLFYSIKARSFFFFNAANPSITNGGMAMESKMDIYKLVPDHLFPRTILIRKAYNWEAAYTAFIKSQIAYPLIVKPDIGMKAFGVEKIHSLEELKIYFQQSPHDFLIQEFVPYKQEIGVFYSRHPEKDKGRITGLVRKEFLSVTGDGTRSIAQLITANPRSHLQFNSLQKKYGIRLNDILPKDEELILVPFGSHTRGARFIDETYLLNPALLQLIDHICQRIPGFYYGRLDILFNSWEELCQGKNFKIIEVNGAGSEATHIYDPRHSIFFAWKEISRHWKILYEISQANRKKGHTYLSWSEGTAMLRENSKLESQLKAL